MDNTTSPNALPNPIGSESVNSVSILPPQAAQADTAQAEETTTPKPPQDTTSSNANTESIRVSDKLMIGLTAAIAFTGILSTWVFYGQLNEMRAGSKDTHDLALQAKASADSAKVMADKAVIQSRATNELAQAATKQVEYTREIAERAVAQADATNNLARAATKQSLIAERALALSSNTDRPWMGILTPSIQSIEADKPIELSFAALNAGRSPARVLEFLVVAGFSKGMPTDPEKGMHPINDVSQVVVVPGNQATNLYKIGPLNKDVVDAINSGAITFYIYSKITYEDIRTHAIHHTRECGYWAPKNKAFVSSPNNNNAD